MPPSVLLLLVTGGGVGEGVEEGGGRWLEGVGLAWGREERREVVWGEEEEEEEGEGDSCWSICPPPDEEIG